MAKSSIKMIETSAWKKIRRDVIALSAQERVVKVGVLEKQGGSETHPNSDLSLVEIATIHEFGLHVPERSFIRATFAQCEAELAKFLTRLARDMFAEKITVERALQLLGQWGVAKVKAFMREGNYPPPADKLAPSTLARRKRIQKTRTGRDIPLIDTGRLLGSIAYEIQ